MRSLRVSKTLCRRNQEYVTAVLADDRFGLGMSAYHPGDRLDYLSGEQIDIHDVEQAAKSAAEMSAATPLRPDPIASVIRLPVVFLDGPGPGSADALFLGWSPPAGDFRWSFCRYAQIAFRLAPEIDLQRRYLLEVESGALNSQPAGVWLNASRVGEIAFSGGIAPPTSQSLAIPGELLRPGEINLLAFEIQAASSLGKEDPRGLGRSFV